MTRARVRGAIAAKRGLPALVFARSGEKSQLWRIPVARHKSFEIMPIPRILLRSQDALDRIPANVRLLGGSLFRGCLDNGERLGRSPEKQKEQNTRAHEDPPGALVSHSKLD
jgi:hypothetical protein